MHRQQPVNLIFRRQARSSIMQNGIYVKLEFNPSSNNYMDIYLVSDNADLSGGVHGYFVRVGSTQDDVCLYKQSGDASTAENIIDGLDDRIDVSAVELNIKVTINHENKRELFVDDALDQTFISERTTMDSEHFFSRHFGIYCDYSSTRSDKFFFDDLLISGELYKDADVPKVDSLLVLSDSSIQLLFNEKMMLSSMENLDGYFVNNGIGTPSTVNADSDTSATLFFSNAFEDGNDNQISIHGIKDLFGNSLDNFVMDFTYHVPYVIGFGDILSQKSWLIPHQV